MWIGVKILSPDPLGRRDSVPAVGEVKVADDAPEAGCAGLPAIGAAASTTRCDGECGQFVRNDCWSAGLAIAADAETTLVVSRSVAMNVL